MAAVVVDQQKAFGCELWGARYGLRGSLGEKAETQ
jgi:hypothetical protein